MPTTHPPHPLTDADKARILDWLLTPAPSGRADRPDRLSRSINRNSGQALLVFHAWCSPEEALEAMRAAALATGCPLGCTATSNCLALRDDNGSECPARPFQLAHGDAA